MFRSLTIRSLQDGLSLLASCCLLMFGFIWLRLWIVSEFDFKQAVEMFSKVVPEFFQKMLPVPIDVIATIEGRVAISFEELPVGLLLALWTVARGSECLAGRLGDGTMEMLLSQPVRRLTLVTSHFAVTLFGVVLIALSAWLAVVAGIATVDFGETTQASIYYPAITNLLTVGVFMAGAATLASALGKSRAHAVAIYVAFHVVEITCKILGVAATSMEWLKKFTFLTAYEPTKLTIGLINEPTEFWPLFWQYNSVLVALGLAAFATAAALFSHRDVPAPV